MITWLKLTQACAGSYPSQSSLVDHFSEKGLTTKWFLLVKPFKYVAHQYYSPCATDLQRSVFICFLLSSFFISCEKLDLEPFDDAQGFKLASEHESIWSVYGN